MLSFVPVVVETFLQVGDHSVQWNKLIWMKVFTSRSDTCVWQYPEEFLFFNQWYLLRGDIVVLRVKPLS